MQCQKEANFLVVILKHHLTRLNPEETEDQSCPCRASAFQETKRGPRLSLSSSFSTLSTALSCDSWHNTFKNPSTIHKTQPESTTTRDLRRSSNGGNVDLNQLKNQ